MDFLICVKWSADWFFIRDLIGCQTLTWWVLLKYSHKQPLRSLSLFPLNRNGNKFAAIHFVTPISTLCKSFVNLWYKMFMLMTAFTVGPSSFEVRLLVTLLKKKVRKIVTTKILCDTKKLSHYVRWARSAPVTLVLTKNSMINKKIIFINFSSSNSFKDKSCFECA